MTARMSGSTPFQGVAAAAEHRDGTLVACGQSEFVVRGVHELADVAEPFREVDACLVVEGGVPQPVADLGQGAHGQARLGPAAQGVECGVIPAGLRRGGLVARQRCGKVQVALGNPA